MKKKNLFILVILCLEIPIYYAQSFTGNSLLLHLNAGIEILHTEYKYIIKNNNLDTLIKDKAANSNYYLGIEYGILKWLGIGIKGKVNQYFTQKNHITNATPTAHSFDIAFTIRTHLFRKKHFDLPIGISIGGSSLTYNNNDPYNPITVYGKGSYFDIHIQPMIYFNRLGVNVYVGTPFIHYNDMATNNANINQYVLMDWKGKGLIFGLGLQFRFLN